MTSLVRHITFNVGPGHEPYALAEFWSRVVDAPVTDDDEPGDDEVGVEVEDGPVLLFVRVPDGKPDVRNRVHVDLQPTIPRDEEVQRLLALGAELVDDRRTSDGKGWAVLADPAGNEFCVERSQAERDAQAEDPEDPED